LVLVEEIEGSKMTEMSEVSRELDSLERAR